MQIVAKIKLPGRAARKPTLAPADRPSRDDLREGGDVGLRVAPVHAQGVEFENLARQVFIDAEFALGFIRAAARREPRELGILADRILIVEKGDHRGVLLHGSEQIDETAVDVRTDRLILERTRDADDGALVRRHRKVVGPKVHQAFCERPRGESGALRACQHLCAVVG